MARTVAIGIQDFEKIRTRNCFYIDKTRFIKEWWENKDDVTLITRPRRFGKTLTMSMLEKFFSLKYANRTDLFEGLDIWNEEGYQELQGTYPVISLSFAGIKENSFQDTKEQISQMFSALYIQHKYVQDSEMLTEVEKAYFEKIIYQKATDSELTKAIYQLSKFLELFYNKKVIVLLDEYDTPMQEAYVGGFWEELVGFTRNLFNSTFKTNPHLERGLMTGITRVSKESIFSDLNNLKVITNTADEYATYFGFTEKEVFAALDECELGEEKEEVKRWYDGFIFGNYADIYNPWSILNFLDTGKYATYWANTSSNRLVGKLLQEGSRHIKDEFEMLLKGNSISCEIDEQIVYNQLDESESAIWSLLLASGYLKVLRVESPKTLVYGENAKYILGLTNYEVELMFRSMIKGWFGRVESDYGDFVKALLQGDIKAMNAYMNRVTIQTFSYFDTGKGAMGAEPERFYHGFVLRLLVELNTRYVVTSNRESGFGRYDVMLEPKNLDDDAIILEFKVHDSEDETDLTATVAAALKQIDEKQYEASLWAKGISKDKIRKYGFAFDGKKVLIG